MPPTEESLHDAGVCVGEDESVGGGLQVGGVGRHALGVDAGEGVQLRHEQDEVAHVDVVAQAVQDEEEVAPVLCRLHCQRGRLLLVSLVLFLLLVFGFDCFRSFFWFLIFVLLSLFLWFLFLLLLVFLGFLFLCFFVFGFSSRFGFQSFSLFIGLLRFFLFSSEEKNKKLDTYLLKNISTK